MWFEIMNDARDLDIVLCAFPQAHRYNMPLPSKVLNRRRQEKRDKHLQFLRCCQDFLYFFCSPVLRKHNRALCIRARCQNMPDQQLLRDTFLRVYKDADDKAHDEAESAPFPAYLEEEVDERNLAPFCPTSARRVLEALDMAKVDEGDLLLDLGSGDGRFCTAAAAVYGARKAVGIETDGELVERSRHLATRVLGENEERMKRLEFIHGDLLTVVQTDEELRSTAWTVIVVFLLPDHTDKFADLLLYHYHRGARIVSLVFNLNEIPGLQLIASHEPDGIYVYRR